MKAISKVEKRRELDMIKPLITENEIAANKVIASILLIIAALYYLVGFLTTANIFKASKWVSVGLFIFGTLLVVLFVYCVILKKQNSLFKYFQILILLLSLFAINVVIGYKIWMLFIVPVFLSVRYYSRRFTALVGFFSALLVVASSFTNAYLAPYLGIIDLNLVSFNEPGYLDYYSWLHNAVINHGFDKGKVIVNGMRLSVFPNCLAILISVITGNSIIANAERMLKKVSDNYEREIQLPRQALVDDLTGLYNRRAYDKDMDELADNPLGADMVYISVDVNGLKTVNDTLGHSAGDEIIVGAADCLTKVFGQYGKVYRIGGDEFVSVIKADANILQTLKSDLEKEVDNWDGTLVHKLAVSCGYVTMQEVEDGADIISIAKLADMKMYKAKTEYYSRNGMDRRKR